MGVSEHTEDNKIVFTIKLTDEDRDVIEEILRKSKRKELMSRLGDCGGEYR